MIYREATLNDIDQLRALGLASYGQFSGILSPENWNKMRFSLQNEQLYIDLINMARSFVCVINDQITGMAFLIPSGNPTDLFLAEWSYIRMVGVYPEHSGKGIGKKLTQLCIDHARKAGEKTICLHTSEIMDAARHIYESLGFTIVKEIPQRYGIKYWIFKLDLASDTRCAGCGTEFHCGNKDNEPCWCSSLPNIVPVTSATCLCPVCLKNKINELTAQKQ
jgi:GNAT superfamily N-acetyltransferase